MHKHVRFLSSGYLTQGVKQGMASGVLPLGASRKTFPSYHQELQLQKYFPAVFAQAVWSQTHPNIPRKALLSGANLLTSKAETCGVSGDAWSIKVSSPVVYQCLRCVL